MAEQTEPTVPVPVSLIECAADAMATMGEMADSNALRALLSQPTPPPNQHVEVAGRTLCIVCWQFDGTHIEVPGVLHEPTPSAEPHDVELCDCGEPAAACAAGRALPVEPPRIEDMAPGTLLELGKRWTVAKDHDGVMFLYAENDGYASMMPASAVDPSTIRDVTPPRVGS